MRKTNDPPWWRAKAQLKSAVRASPTCGEPVGEGQNLTRTGASTPSLPFTVWSVTPMHLVRQGSEPFDHDVHLVADLHRTDTLRGAGQDHVTREQRHHARNVGDECGH